MTHKILKAANKLRSAHPASFFSKPNALKFSQSDDTKQKTLNKLNLAILNADETTQHKLKLEDLYQCLNDYRLIQEQLATYNKQKDELTRKLDDLTNQIAQNIQISNTSYSIPCEQLVADRKDIENQIIALSQECSLYEQTNTDKVNAYLCLIDKLATIENMLREVFSKATTNDVDLSFAAYEALIYIGCSLGLASLVVTGAFYPSVIAAALAVVIGVLPAAVALISFGLFLLLAVTGSIITTDPMIAQLTWWIAENIIPIGLFLGQLTYGAAILIMPYILTAFSLTAVGLLTYGAGVGLHAIYQNSSSNKLFDQCLTEKLIRHGFILNSEVHTETSQAKTGVDLPQLKERLDTPMQLEDSLGLQGMEL